MMRHITAVGVILMVCVGAAEPSFAQPPRPRRIVFLPGPLDAGHPKGTHEYEKTARLLKDCLDRSPLNKEIHTAIYPGGWPAGPKVLDDADTIVLISSGADRRAADHPLLAGDRLATLAKQMRRGCGLVAIHWTLFVPAKKGGDAFLDWIGGYFDYEQGPARDGRAWYSKIQTAKTQAIPATLLHPVARGLKPFEVREEFYYNLRFRPADPRLTPILKVRMPGEADLQTFAWAVERKDGGRGFGFSGGHFLDNWQIDAYRRMVLNAIVWTAHAEVPQDGMSVAVRAVAPNPLDKGKFDQALDARRHYVQIPHRAEYAKPELTVECWAKLDSKKGFNVLVASAPKESADHWEIYTYAGTGGFSAYLPGYAPAEIKSERDLTDGRWHHVAMAFDGRRVRLYVDGDLVKDTRVKQLREGGPAGPLWIGGYPPAGIGCDGLIDEVQISAAILIRGGVPVKAPGVGLGTIGLWHLDDAELSDASRLTNPGKLVPQGATLPAGPSSSTQLDYTPADKRLKAILIDRSPSESYVAVKADTEGRLFVGGREALFVFEPKPGGGYAKTELFRFPPDSWLAGIELRGDDLYVLTGAALYRFTGGRVRRAGLRPERLVWGLPLDLHVSFHALAWGPEGDLYLNHGDPLLTHGDFARPDHWGHWTLFTQPAGTKVSYTGVGSVLKVRPDGSNLRVVATGLRGCFGMAFDRDWNLFTNDNDHESIPDRYTPGRLLHVTPHIDFGWPRGWIASKTPDRADLVEPLLNTPGRGVPVGLAYYDDRLLPVEYRHNLLQDRWDRLAIFRYPLVPRGASVAAQELPFLVGRDNARPIGVAIGRGGQVFATISYMAGNEGSPHYASDLVMITRADDSAAAPFDPYNVTTAPAEKLWAELSDFAWQRRLHAHTEVLRRGGALLDEATRRLARVKADDPAMPHLIWLAAATQRAAAADLLKRLAQATQPAGQRLQAIRALAAFPALGADAALFTRALADPEPGVRLAALAAFFDGKHDLPLAEVAQLAHSDDTYLRQTAARLLAERATLEQLAALCKAKDAPTRLAGVLATGLRLTTPPQVPPAAGIKLAYRAPGAFFSVNIRYGDAPEKPVDLRELGPVGSFTTADFWKADRTAERMSLCILLEKALNDPSERVRLQTAYWLSLLREPRIESAIAAVNLRVKKDRLADAPQHQVGKVWQVGPFDDRTKTPRPGDGAIDLAAEYVGAAGKVRWQQGAAQDGHFKFAPQADQSYFACFQVQSAARQPALLRFGRGPAAELWHNGRSPDQDARASATRALDVLLDLQPGSNDVLVRARAGSELHMSIRARTPMVVTLPESLGLATLAERLKAGGAEKVDAAFLGVDWPAEARKGNSANGRKLFGTLGCVKCHAIVADQKGGGGPSLNEAGKRFTVAYLVESVLLPSKQVGELFRTTRVVTTNGEVVAGLAVGETAETIELLLPDTTRRTVRKVDVEERTQGTVSPMPAGLVRTPAELRDLLAYLLSADPLPP